MNAFLENLFSLQGETAVVFGGTGQLGGTIAEGLAAAGAKVVVVGRNIQRGAARVERIQSDGGIARFGQADAMDRDQVERLAQEICADWKTPSVLINGAGGNHPDATLSPDLRFEELALDAWENVFKMNLVAGALFPAQVFGSRMCRAGGGSIINIASMSGNIPLSKVVAYSAAKAAVLNLTKFLAREWAGHKVRVNSISPGFFPAEQNRKLLFEPDGSYTPRGQDIIGHTMMGRFGNSEELVGAALWLASGNASGFVTGSDICVDGGFSSQTI